MIMFEILRSKIESDRITDFVAIGNLIKEAEAYHSAFVISYGKELYEFHYTGEEIEFKVIDNDYFHKITDTIVSEEVPAFIALCKNILKNANPTYGFFYSGESYNLDGTHLSNLDLGERMTCVGFCLNVLKGFLEEDYIVYEDWTSETHEKNGYLESYCEKYKLDPSKISVSHRRITPRECLTSCFFSELPISKKEIDERIGEVDEYFINLYKISNN